MAIMLLLSGCQKEKPAVELAGKSGGTSTMKVTGTALKLTSSAFEDGGRIPAKYTADGEDISPPLFIDGIPEGTISLALVMDDPDAPMGTWDHWIVWNISPDTNQISAGVEPEGVSGRNSWGRLGYGGPAPPSGTLPGRCRIGRGARRTP